MDASDAASALGLLAKGIPKRLSEAERERRRRSLDKARTKRWLIKRARRAGRENEKLRA